MTSKELIVKIKHIGVEEMRLAIEKIEEDLEVLEWLIANMHVANGLLELRLTPPNNPTFEMKGLKYHNGIPIKNEDFNRYINRIQTIKRNVRIKEVE